LDKYIASSIWFGDEPEPSLIEWELEPINYGTGITWKFTTEGGYPLERLALNLVKKSMAKDFDEGLENLSDYLEENPPQLNRLGEIEKTTLPPMSAMVIPGKGTMEEIAAMMGELYAKIDAGIEAQGLEMNGAPFCHFLSFDMETEISEFLAGIPVSSRGNDSNEVFAKEYGEMEVIQAMHYGPYDEFRFSYEKITDYIQANELEAVFESIEFYYTDPVAEPDVRKWRTLIVFPLK
jgi:effector-binding domain-containing protein